MTPRERVLGLLSHSGIDRVPCFSGMGNPSSAFSFLASKRIKEEFGFPVGCAPSNGSDMVKKKTERTFEKTGFIALDSAATHWPLFSGTISCFLDLSRALHGYSLP